MPALIIGVLICDCCKRPTTFSETTMIAVLNRIVNTGWKRINLPDGGKTWSCPDCSGGPDRQEIASHALVPVAEPATIKINKPN